MYRAALTRWLAGPALTGWEALFCAIIAVAMPTGIRTAVSGIVNGCEFTPYLPFVLASAILLRWWQAAGVAVGCVAVMALMFGAPVLHPGCFYSASTMFLGSSAALIGAVILTRRAMAAMLKVGADEGMGGVVFSLDKGQVWASWYGHGAPVLLGSRGKVTEMMADFLAQEQVAKRLTRE